MKSIIQAAVFFCLISGTAIAQCTVTIPANTYVISTDTMIDCSFIPGHNFLICGGTTLSMTGNSTCVNHFYLENGAVVTFRDSFPNIPYGFFSFYIKGNGVLDYNDNAPVSFGIIDTLVYEPGALLTDTGSSFHYIQMCQSIIFDYSLLPAGSPCVTSSIGKQDANQDFNISPVPFENYLDIEMANATGEATIQIFSFLGKVVEVFNLSDDRKQRLKMKNNWSGAGYVRLLQHGKVAGSKIIVRVN